MQLIDGAILDWYNGWCNGWHNGWLMQRLVDANMFFEKVRFIGTYLYGGERSRQYY